MEVVFPYLFPSVVNPTPILTCQTVARVVCAPLVVKCCEVRQSSSHRSFRTGVRDCSLAPCLTPPDVVVCRGCCDEKDVNDEDRSGEWKLFIECEVNEWLFLPKTAKNG